MQKPDFCSTCPINEYTEGYIPLQRGSGTELWVGESAKEEDLKSSKPFQSGDGAWLNSLLKSARIAKSTLNLINTIGCHPKDGFFPGSDKSCIDSFTAHAGVRHCQKHHIEPTLTQLQPSRIVAMGDEALYNLTGRSGITLWRGSPLPLRGKGKDGPKVIASLHPSYLMKQSGLFSVAVRDLRRSLDVPEEIYDLFPSLDTVRSFNGTVFAFDFEWDQWNNITMCGLSDRNYHAIVVPFVGEYIGELQRIFESAEVIIGHNIIDADMGYFEKLGWKVRAKIHDTMLGQHLIQPDYRHGLAFVASVFTNKVFWKGKGEESEDDAGNIIPTGSQWKTWDSPDAIPREFGGYGGCTSGDEAWRLYNARDTDGSFQAEGGIFSTLRRYNQEPVYWNVSLPAAFICRDLNEHGMRIDHTRLGSIRTQLETDIARIEQTLPEGLVPYEQPITRTVPTPEGTYKPKPVKCKGHKASVGLHEPCEFILTSPEGADCPVCGLRVSRKLSIVKRIKVPDTKRIVPWNSTARVLVYAKQKGCKEIGHLKTGNASADKRARKIWGREHTEFSTVDSLKKLITQRNSFAKDGLLEIDWVKFRLSVTGTSEGRLACRGVYPANLNLQNQPKIIRKIFIPDMPGMGILDHDVVQGENMLTAWLAKDWPRWERLNTPGFDEHCHMASLFFNTHVGPDDPLRKPGKVINHGRNYGLGERKTQDYLAAEGFYYSITDIREMMNIWKTENKRTAAWQQETVHLAERQSYLENPFGRRRWFHGRDFATKALAFLPASTLADMVLRMMIAHFPARFGSEIMALGLNTVGSILHGWRMALQVHDSLVFIGADETHQEMAQVTRGIMTQPWKELDGFRFRIESKYSISSWGDAKVLEVV